MSDYDARDFATIRAALIEAIRSDPALAAVWSDYSDGQIGVILLDLIAWVGDQVEHSLDFRVSELYLATVRLQESVYRIAKSIGYPIRNATASAGDVLLTFGGAPYGPALTLPELTATVGGKAWRYAGGGTLAIAATTLSTTWQQGTQASTTLTGDGTSYQRFNLGTAKIAAGSVSVVIDGFTWTKVDQISAAEYNERKYETFRDEAGNLWLQFGNTYNGLRPVDGISITIGYLITDGATGNVGAEVFDGSTVSWFAAELGTTVTATMSNASPTAGGTNEIGIEDLRDLLVPWTRAAGVGVTAENIETQALSFDDATYGAVAKVKAVLHRADTIANVVRVYVAAATDAYTLAVTSTGLKDALLAFLNITKILTVEYSVADVTFKTVNFAVKARASVGASEDGLETAMTTAIQSLFAVATVELATALKLSDVYDVISEMDTADQLEWYVFTDPTDNVSVDTDVGETVQLGTITFTWE